MNQVANNIIYRKIKRSNSLECTCEVNHMKSVGKCYSKYSMCDICSERLFYQKSKNTLVSLIK